MFYITFKYELTTSHIPITYQYIFNMQLMYLQSFGAPKFELTRQASRSEKSVLWFKGMELPEVIHQLCDEITAFTIHMFLPVLCHFCVKKRRI